MCQVCNVHWSHIPLMMPEPGGLFQIVHMDTMRMPQSNGFLYITQACCSLSAWPKYRMLCTENAIGIAKFILEDILCHHGAIEAIVTDNSTPYIATLKVLRHCYCYNHGADSYIMQSWLVRQALLFSFNLLNLAMPLLSYAVRLVLLLFVLLLPLPCYIYDAILIPTIGYPLYINQYIS